jgi:hypothetical protein
MAQAINMLKYQIYGNLVNPRIRRSFIMKWTEIRSHYPNRWLLVEAIEAHSEEGQRILEELAVVDSFPDSVIAMQRYTQLHREAPERELYVLHTDREKLEIFERQWLGIRRGP